VSENEQQVQLASIIPPEYAGLRFDQALAKIFPSHSRQRLSKWVKAGFCLCDGRLTKPKEIVKGGESISICAPIEVIEEVVAQQMNLHIIHEDDEVLVLNKPANLVVHPAAGHNEGTLLNGLLHHCPQLANLPRAGIVHRLDKDTTGLMVVAKTLTAHTHLVAQMQSRQVERKYLALVNGLVTAGGKVDLPIGRHPKNRIKMAVCNDGKEAITHYRLKKRFLSFTLLDINLETGRTHQIRVHMAHIKHPIVGDPLYGTRMRFPKGADKEVIDLIINLKRQALHAQSLSFVHPKTYEKVQYCAPNPSDIAKLLENLTCLHNN